MIDSLLQIVFYIIVAVGIGVLFCSLIPPAIAILEVVSSRLEGHGIQVNWLERWVDYWIRWEERYR